MGSRNIPETIAAKPAMGLIVRNTRKVRRGREKRRRHGAPALPVLVETPATPAADPVRIAVLAMESLGRASMRACFTGIEVRVAVPDPTIAAIFRAAIAETARTRPTDRLIRIVVE